MPSSVQKHKLKAPTTYQGACSLLARMMTTAYVHGPSSHRRYDTRNGPLDADYFDQAKNELLKLASDSGVQPCEAIQIYWSLSGLLWMAGDFPGAERLARHVVDDGGYLADYARKQLALIMGGFPPEAALDEGDYVTSSIAPEARVPQVTYSDRIEGVHCCMLETKWNPEFSQASGLGTALNKGEPILGQDDSRSSVRLLETSRVPATSPTDIGCCSRYILASVRGLEFLAPYLSVDTRIVEFYLEHFGTFHAISLVETDCLVESSSFVTKTRKGRMKIGRGMFKESEVLERPIFQHVGSWELFVSPKYSRALLKSARQYGIKGIRVVEDISQR